MLPAQLEPARGTTTMSVGIRQRLGPLKRRLETVLQEASSCHPLVDMSVPLEKNLERVRVKSDGSIGVVECTMVCSTESFLVTK